MNNNRLHPRRTIYQRVLGKSVAALAILAFIISSQSPHAQPNFQSCGMVMATCTPTATPTLMIVATCMGPNLIPPTTAYFSFCPTRTGPDCLGFAPPVPTGTNAFQCNGFYPGFAVAIFTTATPLTTRGCDFTIPAAGGVQCSIRGVDGLPVELLDFAIDEDNATGATEEKKGEP